MEKEIFIKKIKEKVEKLLEQNFNYMKSQIEEKIDEASVMEPETLENVKDIPEKLSELSDNLFAKMVFVIILEEIKKECQRSFNNGLKMLTDHLSQKDNDSRYFFIFNERKYVIIDKKEQMSRDISFASKVLEADYDEVKELIISMGIKDEYFCDLLLFRFFQPKERVIALKNLLNEPNYLKIRDYKRCYEEQMESIDAYLLELLSENIWSVENLENVKFN